MNYAEIRKMDISNGEGFRVSLFVSGCMFHCKNCFNKDLWDYSYGKPYTEETEKKILKLIDKENISGLSILGGDPFCQHESGILQLISLCDKVHELGKTVWIWTGFTWEQLFLLEPIPGEDSDTRLLREELAIKADVLVDGPFIDTQKDLGLVFRGSSNQRIIDVKKSLQKGNPVIYERNYK